MTIEEKAKTGKEWAWYFYQELGYMITDGEEQETALKEAMLEVLSVAQQEIDDCRTEATKELLNLAIHGLKEAQNGESSDCVSTFATIIEKLGIHVEYDEWHEPIIDVEQVKTVLEGNEKEKVKPK